MGRRAMTLFVPALGLIACISVWMGTTAPAASGGPGEAVRDATWVVREANLAPELQFAVAYAKQAREHPRGNAFRRVILRTHDPEALAAHHELGIGGVIGSYLSATVACEDLVALSRLPGIEYVESGSDQLLIGGAEKNSFRNEPVVRPQLDVAFAAAGPPLVGFVEDSFDPYDPVVAGFEAPGARYLAIWDQTDQTGRSPGEISTSYGSEYLADEIRDRPKSLVAMGSGAATSHGTRIARLISRYATRDVSWRFVAVKSDLSKASILDAIAYIRAKALALHRPVIINLSMGTHAGPHDGSSVLEETLTAAEAPGCLLVVAAGNGGALDCHASIAGGPSAESGQVILPFYAYRVRREGAKFGELRIEIWCDAMAASQVRLKSPRGEVLGPVREGQGVILNGAYGRVTIANGLSRPPNGLHQIVFTISDRDDERLLPSGMWQAILDSPALSKPCRWDAWIECAGRAQARFTQYMQPAGTVSSPGTARGVICAGSGSVDGSVPASSLGPTRDGRDKPEVWCPDQPRSSEAAAETTGRLTAELARNPALSRDQAIHLLQNRDVAQ